MSPTLSVPSYQLTDYFLYNTFPYLDGKTNLFLCFLFEEREGSIRAWNDAFVYKREINYRTECASVHTDYV